MSEISELKEIVSNLCDEFEDFIEMQNSMSATLENLLESFENRIVALENKINI